MAVGDTKTIIKKSDDIYLALLNIGNTPPRGHNISPVQHILERRTHWTIPRSAELLMQLKLQTQKLSLLPYNFGRLSQKLTTTNTHNLPSNHSHSVHTPMQSLVHPNKVLLGCLARLRPTQLRVLSRMKQASTSFAVMEPNSTLPHHHKKR